MNLKQQNRAMFVFIVTATEMKYKSFLIVIEIQHAHILTILFRTHFNKPLVSTSQFLSRLILLTFAKENQVYDVCPR